jgi:hypothetical protein
MRVVEGPVPGNPGDGSTKELDGISMSFPSVPVGCTAAEQSLFRYAISSRSSVHSLVLPIAVTPGE